VVRVKESSGRMLVIVILVGPPSSQVAMRGSLILRWLRNEFRKLRSWVIHLESRETRLGVY
jgi:hypothetical protein